MALYGVKVEHDEYGADFYALSANDDTEARHEATLIFSEGFKICPLEDLLEEQYRGLALLSTF